MAIAETKILQVENSPSVINQSNNEWGHFGWNVLGVQVTHSQDTKTYTKGLDYYTGDKTVETTTINYATITYQRNKEMPNYRKIVALENEYISTLEQIDSIYSATPDGTINFKIALISLLVWPVCVGYIVYKIMQKVKASSYIAENSSKVEALKARCMQLMNEAEALL